MAHFMNSEISTPLNNHLYTEYAGAFSFLFRLSKVIWVFTFGNALGIMVKCQPLFLLLRILLLH